MLYSIYLYFNLVLAKFLSLINEFKVENVRNTTIIFLAVLLIIFLKKNGWQKFIISVKAINFRNKMLYAFTLLIASSVIAGVFITQNLWDSMSYHLPRYLHWFQNENRDFYFTTNQRQNVSPPLPDLLFAQMFAVFSNDKFLFLPTLLAILVSSFFIYKIVFLLTQNKDISILALILSLLVPSQVAFMSSTQTDPVSTALVVMLLYYAIYSTKSINQLLIYKMLLLVPLFIVSKTTGLIFSIPIYLFVIYKHWRFIVNNIGKNILLLLLMLIPAVPYVLRVLSVGRDAGSGVFVKELSLEGIIANFSRIFLSILQTPLGAINSFLERGLYKIFALLNLDLNPEGYGEYGNFYLSNSLHGDLIGNPIHFVLIILASIFLIRIKTYRLISILILLQLFFLATTIGWQPWINRFTSTLLVIGSILIAVWLFQLSKRVRVLIIVGVITYSSFWVFYNPTRSLLDPKPLLAFAQVFGMDAEDLTKIRHDLALPRERQYFSVRPEIEDSYLEAIEEFNKQPAEKIYITIGGDDFEYPIWALTDFVVEIRHLDKNTSQIEEIKKGEAYLFCTVDCSDLGLNLSYQGEFASLWRGN